MSNFNMDDYVPVAERVDAFKQTYPDGSLQSKIVELTDSRVTVMAMAYRTPEDPRPGIGHSSLEIPGKTPYTKGSEIENCETSAWGRAIAALGFEVKRGLASAEEVRNKQPERGGGSPSSPRRAPAQYRRGELAQLMKDHNLGLDAVEAIAERLNITERPMSDASMDRLIEAIESERAGSAPEPAPSTPQAERSVPAAATATATEDEGVPPATSSEPSSAPSFDDILAVSGGEEIPPKPKTDEYRALPPLERAAARAYWDKRPQEEQESLAVALGAPES